MDDTTGNLFTITYSLKWWRWGKENYRPRK